MDIRYMSLFKLILTAYRLKPYQLSGPEWMRAQRFDIAAKIPDGASREQIPEMLQALLAERFKLSMHRDNKEQLVLALVVGKNGLKLKESTESDARVPAAAPGEMSLYTADGEAHMEKNGGAWITAGPLGPVQAPKPGEGQPRFELLAISMPGLADLASVHEDRPVIDMTDLKGRYHIQVVMDLPAPPAGGGGRKGDGGPPPADAPPPRDFFADGLRSALEKGGLKLEPRRAPVATMVVDHLEKTPTEN